MRPSTLFYKEDLPNNVQQHLLRIMEKLGFLAFCLLLGSAFHLEATSPHDLLIPDRQTSFCIEEGLGFFVVIFSHTLQACYSHVTSEGRQLRLGLDAGRP